MTLTIPHILLITGSPMGVSFLIARLNNSECKIHFATSCKEANALVSNRRFDLLLSDFRLSYSSPYPMAHLLIGSNTTLVYSYPVESGCWWLPAVKKGQSCWGSLATRPSEFIGFLDDILKEIRFRPAANSDEFSEQPFKVAAG